MGRLSLDVETATEENQVRRELNERERDRQEGKRTYTTPFGALDLTSRLAAVVW